MPENEPKAAVATERMVEAVVAPRRSVCVEGTLAQALPTPGSTGFARAYQIGRYAGPGETVRLPASEVQRLRKLGALVDPDADAIPVALGPSYDLVDGRPAPGANVKIAAE